MLREDREPYPAPEPFSGASVKVPGWGGAFMETQVGPTPGPVVLNSPYHEASPSWMPYLSSMLPALQSSPRHVPGWLQREIRKLASSDSHRII